MKRIYNVGIIGAGIAGLSATIQLKRYEIDFIIFEKNKIGGLINNANKIMNYPGLFNISGENFVEQLNKHLKYNKIKIVKKEIVKIRFDNSLFIAYTNNNYYFFKNLIVANGTEPVCPKHFNLLSKDIKKKIYFEITKLKNKTNKSILIIGSGDIAFDYALSLSEKNRIIIFNKNNKIKALPCLQNAIKHSQNIFYYEKHIIKKIEMKKKLLIKDNYNNCYTFDYIVYAIGRKPASQKFINIENKQIKNLKKNKRIFIIGDANTPKFKQLSIASSQGTKIAMIIKNNYENY